MKNSSVSRFGRRYTESEEIGAGGGGRVYKAYDTVRAEYVAVKELSRRHVDSSAAVLRFKNEFRIMSEFQHPNMVRVFEFGLSHDNIPFMTMEFVPGHNLSALANPSVKQVVDILSQVCQTLAVIHSRLYAHRDLKPSNIKLLDDGSIKLLDYGLMSQLGIPAPGKISGTVYYLAPEVIVGGVIDESTDLYSLGVIGYELLTGARPFTGNSAEILQGHLKQNPPAPMTLRPDVPPSLNSLVLKLLAKDKQQRYRNSAAVLEDLQLISGKGGLIETTGQKYGYLYSRKLVGRTKEIEYYQKCLRQLNQGQSTSLFIGAPAGMGKTRLLNEMRTLAELEGVSPLYLGGQRADDRVYGWTAGLLRQLASLSTEQEIRQYGQALARVSGELQGPAPGNGNGQPLSDEKIVVAVIAWFGAVTQRTPLILFLDNLHWLDLKSGRVLNELIRNQNKLRIAVVGAFRNDEVEKTSPLWHTLEEGLTEYLELAPLTEPLARTLLEQLLYPTAISAEFSTYIFNNSGGNVFDVLELLRYMITAGHLTKSGGQWQEPVNLDTLSLPKTLADRLARRLDKLSDEASLLADAASILGDELNLESWQAVSSYAEDTFFRAIDDLLAQQIVIKTNGDYQFGHDRIRHILYKNLSKAQKKDYHLRAAKFFEEKLPESQRRLVPTIARHFVAAESGVQAIDYSLQTARAAEQNGAEWEAFAHYQNAARFLETEPTYPNRHVLLLEIYEKAAQFSSAAWIDAATCLKWLQQAIEFYAQEQNREKVFDLSLAYIVTCAITSNYQAARYKIAAVLQTGQVAAGTTAWAILHGAGVCLVDWYQGYQNDCLAHAVAAIDIFEAQLETLPAEVWPAYSWALFWRDKARAYLGQPIDMANIEKIHQLMVEGKSDQTIYWHTLTAVGARAAFTGRWADLLAWKQLASQLSREMGKIYWFECWISHSYLYGALQHGELAQLKNHIERVRASPDPYQVRLAYLFQGRLDLIQGQYQAAEKSFQQFLWLEEESQDNSYLEGFIYLAKTYLATGQLDQAGRYIEQGVPLAVAGNYENPLYQLQIWLLKAEWAMAKANYIQATQYLALSLVLAEWLDNPIQTAFIQKMWGELCLRQKDFEQARQRLGQASAIFLSLDNKYQAGQVVKILESLPHPPSLAPKPAKTLDNRQFTETGSEEGSDIRLEDKVMAKLKELARKTQPKATSKPLEETDTEI